MRGQLVVMVTGIAALVGDASANDPERSDSCKSSLRRADDAATTTIVARLIAVIDAGTPCRASGAPSRRGCVVGAVRHGATCAPIAGTQVQLGKRTVVTDRSGVYRVCGVGRGEHALVVPMIGATRKVHAGDVVDVDATSLGDLGIRLAVTSIVTFKVERVVVGATIASPATIFVQPSPPPTMASEVRLEDVRPAPAIGKPLELRVARDPATGVLVSETCWIRKR